MVAHARDLEKVDGGKRMFKGAAILSAIALLFSIAYVYYYSYWGFDAIFVPWSLLGLLFDGELFNEFASVLFALTRMAVPVLLIATCVYRGGGGRLLLVAAFVIECICSFLAMVIGYGMIPVGDICGFTFSVIALIVVVAAPLLKKKLPVFPFVAFGALVLLSLVLMPTDLSPYGWIDFGDGDAELIVSSLIRNPAIWASGSLLCVGMEEDERVEKNRKGKVVAEGSQNHSSIASVASEVKAYRELLNMGAITQEEFDAKKRELLGL